MIQPLSWQEQQKLVETLSVDQLGSAARQVDDAGVDGDHFTTHEPVEIDVGQLGAAAGQDSADRLGLGDASS